MGLSPLEKLRTTRALRGVERVAGAWAGIVEARRADFEVADAEAAAAREAQAAASAAFSQATIYLGLGAERPRPGVTAERVEQLYAAACAAQDALSGFDAARTGAHTALRHAEQALLAAQAELANCRGLLGLEGAPPEATGAEAAAEDVGGGRPVGAPSEAPAPARPATIFERLRRG